ncbi:MAG TPA: TonB-dependent receptor [Longimicrobiales bacterium]|nr:TonB-dependent receptor [Longimicrobiales bacterium]
MNCRMVLALVVIAGLAGLAAGPAAPVAVAQTPPGSERAAGPGRITGQVTDPEGRALETAAIEVRTASDSALVTGALTDGNGQFRITGLAPGRYRIRVSLLGYRPRSSETIELTAESPAAELGTIRLEPVALEVEGIEAVAERAAVMVQADRTIYNTSNMPVASAGNATDVLRAVPELEVDADNNVKMRGNQPVAIHLNGRPMPLRGEQLANFLQQLPGDRIERIEVMPNPSARHDPEGTGGIVNIVLKENTDFGLSGSFSANASTRNRWYANGRLNYQRGRLTLFSGLGGNLFRNDSRTHDLRENLVTVPVTVIEQNGVSTNRSWGWHADWTAELRVGRQATLWSDAWMFGSYGHNDGTTDYGIFDVDRAVRERYNHVTESRSLSGITTSVSVSSRCSSRRRRS